MIWYIVVFGCTALLAFGLLLLKKPFFSFSLAAVKQLDIILDATLDDAGRQKKLLRNLGVLLTGFFRFLLWLTAVTGLSLVPAFAYLELTGTPYEEADTGSLKFIVALVLGSAVLFIPFRKEKSDYSGWSRLLHHMLLDNYAFSRYLFRRERKAYREKAGTGNDRFVVVSGLARAGTTALTNLLFATGKFHSLSYANMPFLLAVNTWRRLYKPRTAALKERAHGDRVLFGYDTVEALEEFFFKAFLNDSFIAEKGLKEHEINDDTYDAYLAYQGLVNAGAPDSVYLAKNNNLVLRYPSLREHNQAFRVLLIFRDPLDHAWSLLKQHRRFCEMQSKDPFVQDYMNWLGHHEFGLNHKPFILTGTETENPYDSGSIDCWVFSWIRYYSRILDFSGDENFFLIDYADLLERPERLLSAVGQSLQMDFPVIEQAPFKKSAPPGESADARLLQRAQALHGRLAGMKIQAGG